jgi:hypothetical protein
MGTARFLPFGSYVPSSSYHQSTQKTAATTAIQSILSSRITSKGKPSSAITGMDCVFCLLLTLPFFFLHVFFSASYFHVLVFYFFFLLPFWG